MIKKMVKVFTFGKMELSILATFRMIIAMDMVKCIGKMVKYIKVNGLMVFRQINLLNLNLKD